MKVILLKAVQKVGKEGDIVEVSDGYAQNSLFPHRYAIQATEKNLELLQKKKASASAKKALEHDLLERAIQNLGDTPLVLKVPANDQGHLFSKITQAKIVEALGEKRISVSEKNIVISSQIKIIGTYNIFIKEGENEKKIVLEIQKK